MYDLMAISVIQINLNKSRKSLDNLYSYLVRNPNTIGIVQEIYNFISAFLFLSKITQKGVKFFDL